MLVPKLANVTVTEAAGLKADLSAATVTSIDASASTGAKTVSLNATKASYAGGSGVDNVTITAAPTKVISGGAGTADVLTVNIAGGFNASANANISGFETLSLGALATGVYHATGFTNLSIGTLPNSTNFLLVNVAAGTGLLLTAATGATEVSYYLANSDGDADVLNLTIAVAATGANKVIASGIETVNITVSNTSATAITETLDLFGTVVSKINVKSDALAGVILMDTNNKITALDASAVSGGDFTWTTGALTDSSIITGSATGNNTINFRAAAGSVTYVGGAGIDSITGNNGTVANTVNLGNGSNSYFSFSSGVQTVTGGTGTDSIITGSGADIIVDGGGSNNFITAGSGADKITVSGNASTITQTVGSSGTNSTLANAASESTLTFDVVYGATAGLKLNIFDNTAIVTANLTTAATDLAKSTADNTAVFARGGYSSTDNTFTYAANGADTAVTYDSSNGTGVTAETIILVGYVSGASTAVAGVITLG